MLRLKYKTTIAGALTLLILLLFATASTWAAKVWIFRDHQNGRVEGYDQVDPEMFRPHPMGASYYSEPWSHLLQFEEQGIVVIITFQLHNVGVKDGNMNVAAIISDTSEEEIIEMDYFTPEQLKIDYYNFSVQAGDHQIKLNGENYTVKFQGDEIQADFNMKILAPSFQQGKGLMYFEKSGDFVKVNFPIPWAEVQGTLTYRGKTLELEGWGSMNHDWQVLSPYRVMKDGRGFWLYSDEAVIICSKVTSAALGNTWVQRLLVAERGKILFSSHDYKLEELDLQPMEGEGISFPGRYRLEVVHGDDWLRGEIKVRRIRQKAEMLSFLPDFLMKLARPFIDQTWAFLYINDFQFELHLDGKTRVIKGTGTGNYIQSVKNSR